MQTVIDILTNIGFDWRVALANLVNFIIIFWLLDKFVFGVVRKALKERKEKIETGIESAQKADTALMMAEQEKRGLIKDAHIQANSIASDAYKKAKETVRLSAQEAQLKYDEILNDAQKDIDRKKAQLEKDLEAQTAEMVISGVEKVLRNEMSPELQEKMVKSLTS